MSETDNASASEPETPDDQPSDASAAPMPDKAIEDTDVAALRHEAATYRRQLRSTEAERDRLRGMLDDRDRGDAEKIAGQTMAAGADLWVAGVELDALRDDDGALSEQFVEEAVARVLEQRPHWRKLVTGSFDGGARMSAPMVPTHPFGEALKNAGRP